MERRDDQGAIRASTAEVRAGLETSFREYAQLRRIIDVRRRASLQRTSFAIEELDVYLDDGSKLELICKDLSRRALSDCAAKAKPAFLYDPLREIETYRSILSRLDLGTPTLYGAIVHGPENVYWLFLERAAGTELYKLGEMETWHEVARWLASLHSSVAALPDLRDRPALYHLLDYNEEYFRLWMRRAHDVASCARGSVGAEIRAKIRQLASRYEEVVNVLTKLPRTLIHGEFYPSNILVGQGGDGLRVCPVDWEMAAIGPGLLDVAALSAGKWSNAERRGIVLAYQEAAAQRGLSTVVGTDLGTALNCCRLHIAVQWLGWSLDWAPPPEHAQDWLGEAMHAAQELDLL